jgi:hypothetical protein
MSDEKRRRAERDAAVGLVDKASVAHEFARAGLHPLASRVGDWLLVETWKMNYRGCLVDVVNIDGQTTLAFHPMYRVGDYGADGPVAEARMETAPDKPSLLPWSSVAELSTMPLQWTRA